MNLVMMIGRLTKDAEIRYQAETGLAVTKFTLAVRRNENTTDFFNCVIFGKLAEAITDYLTKGKLVAVTGKLQMREYQKDGQKRITLEIVVSEIQLLEKKDKDFEEIDENYDPFSEAK